MPLVVLEALITNLVMFGECLVIPALHQSLGSGSKGFGLNYFMGNGGHDESGESVKWKRALLTFPDTFDLVNPDYVNW